MSAGDRLDLDAIQQRAVKFVKASVVAAHVGGPYGANTAARESAADVPALLAEVERLRGSLAELVGLQDSPQGWGPDTAAWDRARAALAGLPNGGVR